MDKLTQFKELIAQYCQVAAEDMREDMRFSPSSPAKSSFPSVIMTKDGWQAY